MISSDNRDEVKRLQALGLAEWQARIIVKASQLREQKVRGMLILWDGPAMNIFRMTPDGRCEVDSAIKT